MANSQQIGGARSEHQGVGGEAREKQRACLVASRDSKRDVTANPIRKTAKFNAAGPPDSRRLAVAAAVDGIEPKNRRCRAVACGGVSGDWVADDSLMRVVLWREERIPLVTQCQNARREVQERRRTRSNVTLVGGDCGAASYRMRSYVVEQFIHHSVQGARHAGSLPAEERRTIQVGIIGVESQKKHI